MTFNIDANGILNVSTVDKSTVKQNKSTITNNKGRLSKEDIEWMVKEAEEFKNEDDIQKDRITAKNALESYAYNMKSTMEGEKLKDNISDSDKKLVDEKCEDMMKWLDANQLAEKEEVEHKQKGIGRGLFTHHHQTLPGCWMPGAGGPTIEEVD